MRWVAVLLAISAALALVFLLSGRVPVALATGPNMAQVPATDVGYDIGPAAPIVLLAASVAAALVAVASRRRARHLRSGLGLGGLGPDARLLAADSAQLGAITLSSSHLGLVARPDQVVRLAKGTHIPVEHKPRATRLYRSHVLELAVQLMLVERHFGQRPLFGLVVLAGGVAKRIPFEQSLEVAVSAAAERMQRHIATSEAPRRRWLGNKCRACEFFDHCWGDWNDDDGSLN
jgi:Domain of unknown function DUF83